jgi:hypothetical protein
MSPATFTGAPWMSTVSRAVRDAAFHALTSVTVFTGLKSFFANPGTTACTLRRFVSVPPFTLIWISVSPNFSLRRRTTSGSVRKR